MENKLILLRRTSASVPTPPSGRVTIFIDSADDMVKVKLSTGSVVQVSKDATLATDSVGSSQIAADAVGSSEIAANAVGTSEIADNTIAFSDIVAAAAAGLVGATAAGNLSVLTPAQINSITGQATYVNKPSDTTRNSTATLANDPHLSFPVTANKIYRLRILLLFNTGATPDFKAAISGVATTLINLLRRAKVPSASTYSFIAIESAFNTATLTDTGTGNGFLEWEGFVEFSASGTVNVQWAQNTSDPADTILRRGSFIEYTQIN